MSEEPVANTLSLEELEVLKKDFLDYLDGKVAPLFAADSLSQVLRVDPPVHFPPRELAEIVAGWARNRAPYDQRPIHEYYLKSIDLIVTADRTGVLAAFKPSPFYMPYFEGLVRNCPAEEKAQFRERLKALREDLFKEWGYEFRRAEFEVTATVETNPEDKEPLPDDIGPLVAKLRNSAIRFSPQQEQESIAQLQLVIGQVLAVPGAIITPHLEFLIDLSIYVFNNGKPVFAAHLLYVVQQVYNWGGFNEISREGLKKVRSGRSLDESQIRNLASKPEFNPALQIFLTHFDDLNPYSLLTDLAHETDRQKRRSIISLVEAHGDTAAPMIIHFLSHLQADQDNWYFVRNLVYLLGRVAPQDAEGQHVCIGLLGPYLRSPFFRLRMAAMESMGSFTSEEAIDPIRHVFDDNLYTEEELSNQERISAYLNNAIAIIGRFDSENALRLLVEIALGRHIDFISDKLARPLRLFSMQTLAAKRDRLSPMLLAPIIERIRNLTSRWKKLVSRLLGDDELELIALLDIVAHAPSPQVIDLLKEIKSRYADELSGRRAGELLAQLQIT